MPFLDEKIPVIDLIDFEYGPGGSHAYWHTQEDTIDKLDKRSLERTGTLVLTALPAVEKMVLKGILAGAPKAPVEPPEAAGVGADDAVESAGFNDQCRLEAGGPGRPSRGVEYPFPGSNQSRSERPP